MRLRHAEDSDLAAIQSIYAHHVLHGTGTFEETPPSVEEIEARFGAARAQGWRWLVAEDESGILGYAAFARFRDRSGYRYCAEDSIYVRDDVRGQGVGKALVTRVLTEAAACGFRQMIAVVGDAENAGSIGVHASLGFRQVGVLRAVGWKFGRWLDAVYMQRALDGEAPSA